MRERKFIEPFSVEQSTQGASFQFQKDVLGKAEAVEAIIANMGMEMGEWHEAFVVFDDKLKLSQKSLATDDIRKADVVGAYSCIKTVCTEEFGKKQGTILLTGGVAAISPFPGYLCLAMDKGGLRGLTLAMHNDLAPRGIFVGTVMVCGIVGGSDRFAPANIAETYWQMYTERKEWEVKYE